MNKLAVKEGDKFNKLTIIKEVERASKDKRRFLCICECGQLKEVNLIHLTTNATKSCGCSSREWNRIHIRESNPNWKGGRRIVEGYCEVYLPTHPFARANGYIKEHRYVMEQKIGRLLLRTENVHHINGNKMDNRIENLELWNTSQPSGQRVKDKVEWAKEILELYKSDHG